MARILRALLVGIGVTALMALIGTFASIIYITQGHWNPAYVIGSFAFLGFLSGVIFGILTWRASR